MRESRRLPLLIVAGAFMFLAAQLVACGDPEESASEEATKGV